ncbi:MAG: hypothetical protein KME55_30915 [Nostoc indistinguendum CM1-VF10]|nr:hypothetical protein [Nostoc indistinguendum CM1-VF10]
MKRWLRRAAPTPILRSALFDLCKQIAPEFPESTMATPAASIAVAVIDFWLQS